MLMSCDQCDGMEGNCYSLKIICNAPRSIQTPATIVLKVQEFRV